MKHEPHESCSHKNDPYDHMNQNKNENKKEKNKKLEKGEEVKETKKAYVPKQLYALSHNIQYG